MMFATKQEYITIRYVSFVRTRMNVVGMKMMMKSNYYDWYKSHGICPRCRKEDAAKGHVYCLNCLDRESVSTMLYKASHDTRDRNKAECRERYYRAKERGFCVRCKHRKAREGKTTCQVCFNKIREKQMIYQRLKRMEKKGC